MWWWILIFTVIVLLLATKPIPSQYSTKTVWLLWMQGWDNAPSLVTKVKDSWVTKNPGWNIQLVSKENLGEFMDTSKIPWEASMQAQSDVIRIHLLEKHGGVWADSTLFCTRPLDLWLPDFDSIWMYRGSLLYTYGKGPASWFICAKKGSYSVRRWKEKVDEYWSSRKSTLNYFWLDSLWWDLYNSDRQFAEEWDSFESPSANAEGGPGMLAGKVNGVSKEVQDEFVKHKPPVIKLSLRDYDENENGTHTNFILEHYK
jgi:hypothetical protein